MIPNENIEEITGLLYQSRWMIYLPFIIYFAFSLLQLWGMKNELNRIQIAINKHVNDHFEPLNNNFDEFSILPLQRDEYRVLFDNLSSSVSLLRWKRIEDLPNWRIEFAEVMAFNIGLLKGSVFRHENVESLIKIETNLLNIGEQYPELRRYLSLVLAEKITNLFASTLMIPNSSCFHRNYFNPILQRFGDSYYVYPDKTSNVVRQPAEIKVNGNLASHNLFTFRPYKRGMNILDIEYTFWGNHGIQTINFR